MTKPTGTGTLFENMARATFLRVTADRYRNMLERVKRKGFPGLPFSRHDFRLHLLDAAGGRYDGFYRCRYCAGYFTIAEIAIDHAVPLMRGGGVESSNLEYPCKACNAAKGGMLPQEYEKLLRFLDTQIPLARQDVLSRLQMSIQLAAQSRYHRKRRDAQGEDQ